jgi:hypothetical protein
VPAIIYDFKAIGGALRKQRIDDWWPAKPEPESARDRLAKKIKADIESASADPFGGWVGGY